MSRRDREDREERTRKVADYDRRVNEHTTDRPSLVMPEGLRLWNPKKEGQYEIEIVPYELSDLSKKFVKNYADPGYLYPERTYFNHREIGVNNDSVVCPAKTFGEDCPICEHRKILGTKTDAASATLLKALAWKERQLFLILDNDDIRKGLQLWDISFHLFGKQLEAKIGRMKPEQRDRAKKYFDPDKGLTLVLGATEKTMGPGSKPFLEFGIDEFKTREEPIPDKYLNHTFNLDAIPNRMSYDEIKKIFLQADTDDDKKEDKKSDDDRPRTRSRDEDDDRPSRRSRDEDDAPRRPRDDEDDTPRSRRAEEPEKTKSKDEIVWKKGDEVEFEYRNKTYVGDIIKLNDERQLAQVQVDGEEDPRSVGYDDLRPVKKKADKPKEEPKKSARDEDDDRPSRRSRDEDDDRPRTRSREEEPEKTKKSGKDDGWDDEPLEPKPKTRTKEPEEEPARGRRGK